MSDWSPEAYSRFRGLRLRPAVDLLLQLGELPEGDLVDLGCGDGAAGAALAARFPGRPITGVDTAPKMLEAARAAGHYAALHEADVTSWVPPAPPALIFSNALLHWLPDHTALMPRLAGQLAPGGVLAVQMPRQFDAPSHAQLREIAETMFPDRFDFGAWEAPVWPATDYLRLLAPLGEIAAWETEYVQRLAPSGAAHPVRLFTESTAMRPFLDRLAASERAAYVAAYEAALGAAYPAEEDGSVLFPFRRVFFVLRL